MPWTTMKEPIHTMGWEKGKAGDEGGTEEGGELGDKLATTIESLVFFNGGIQKDFSQNPKNDFFSAKIAA